nr:unnamed protein product [Callosobruchus chinensis]
MLTWKDQINKLSKKLCKTIFFIRNLYHGYFQSALSYAIFIWDPYSPMYIIYTPVSILCEKE